MTSTDVRAEDLPTWCAEHGLKFTETKNGHR